MTSLPRTTPRIKPLPFAAEGVSPWPIVMAAAWLLLIGWAGGMRPVHVVAASLSLLEYAHPLTRRFLRLFFPVLLVGIAYDSMRYYYWAGVAGHVHVAEPYFRDLSWFGINVTGAAGETIRLTPNEFWARHPVMLLDVFCGLSYLTFFAQYIAVMLYMFVKNELGELWRMAWTFALVNIAGFITYFAYPAAPPWYVSEYGLGPARMHVVAEPAGAARFDQIFGTHFFDNMYAQGIDIYGAYPSLHVTYPLLVAWATFQVPGMRLLRAPACAFYGLMCLSAVYLQHHYVVDIVLGSLYGVAGLWVVTWMKNRRESLPTA